MYFCFVLSQHFSEICLMTRRLEIFELRDGFFGRTFVISVTVSISIKMFGDKFGGTFQAYQCEWEVKIKNFSSLDFCNIIWHSSIAWNELSFTFHISRVKHDKIFTQNYAHLPSHCLICVVKCDSECLNFVWFDYASLAEQFSRKDALSSRD